MEYTYKTCAKIRKAIDEVLHKNAILFQNATPNAKELEKENLRTVRHLDPAFIDFLLDASDV